MANPGSSLADSDGDSPVRYRWTQRGTGESFDVRLADLDRDGANEVVVGGRGVATLDAASLEDGRPRWVNKWPDVENLARGGDYEFVLEMEVADVSGDGIPDIIAGTGTALHAIDGSTGTSLWRTLDLGLGGDERGGWQLAIADFDRDGVDDVAYASLVDDRIRAVNGADGTPLWWYPRSGAVLDMVADDVNLDGFTDLVVVGMDGLPEIHAISGLLMGTAGVAHPLWVQRFPAELPVGPSGNFIIIGGDPTVVRTGNVAPGGTPEVVVGDYNGNMGVLDGATGQVQAAWEFPGSVTDIVLTQLDGDAPAELVVGSSREYQGGGGGILAFEGDGSQIWSRPTAAPVVDLDLLDLDGDQDAEMVAVGGGDLLAIEPRASAAVGGVPPLLWGRTAPRDATKVAAGDVFGAPGIVVGYSPSGVAGYGLDGESLWFHRTGGRVEDVVVADLDGKGSPEIIEVAGDNHVAVLEADGALRWTRLVPGAGSAGLEAAAAGDLTEHEGSEVVVGSFGGAVQTYSADGVALWDTRVPGWLGELLVDDLEGDGQREVLAATFSGAVTRLTGDGQLVWQSGPVIAVGQIAVGVSVALTHVDDDGVLDVIVGTRPVFPPGYIFALSGATGEELWRRQISAPVTWLSVTGDPADGIAAGDLGGQVFVMDTETGADEWLVDHGGWSGDGEWTVDLDADGSLDLVVGIGDDVLAVSGTDGNQIWRSTPKPGDGVNRLAVFRSRETLRVAVGGMSGDVRYRSNLHVLELRTGDLLGSIPTEHGVLDLAPGDLDGDGLEEVVAGAGWQVHAVETAA